MLSDVGRAKETRVIQENSLHQLSHIHADAKLAFVFLEHSKNLSASYPECWMSEAYRLLRMLQLEREFS